jgi:cyclopropane fatty-acyl-phospholipid synthase-like methyltransferase
MDKIHNNRESLEDYFRGAYAQHDMTSLPWVTGAVGIELQKRVIDRTLQEGISVFEVGCGVGTESVFLSRHGMSVTSIDKEESALDMAQRYAELLGTPVSFIHDDFLDVDLDSPCDLYYSVEKECGKKVISPLRGRFHAVIDQGCFHHILPEYRSHYAKKVADLLDDEGRYIMRGFSDLIPPSTTGDGPFRLTSAEITDCFGKEFRLEALYLFDNLPVPGKNHIPQKFWYLEAVRK